VAPTPPAHQHQGSLLLTVNSTALASFIAPPPRPAQVGRVLGAMDVQSTDINTKGFDALLNLVENTSHDSFDLYYGLFLYNANATGGRGAPSMDQRLWRAAMPCARVDRLPVELERGAPPRRRRPHSRRACQNRTP
jgi:hypothetical protein